MLFRIATPPGISDGGTMTKTLRIMKLSIFLLVVACLKVTANGYSQVSLSEKNATMSSVIKKIQKQTGYDFLYGAQVLERAGTVSIKVNNQSLEQVLDLCFRDKPLTYSIMEKTVIIKIKPVINQETSENRNLKEIVTGKVVDAQGNPLAGATVSLKGSNKTSVTDASGAFSLELDELKGTLVVTYVGMAPQEIVLNGKRLFSKSRWLRQQRICLMWS